MRPPRGLAPLRHRDFRLLVAGQLTSNAGDALYAVALPWYVLAVHGGALVLGTVLAAYGIARGVMLAVGGHASDRFKPWTAMLCADAARALAIAALTVVAALRPAGVVLLLPISIVLGAADGIFLPASYAIVPALLADDDLQPGNALTFGSTQLATLVGPGVGGAIVALAGSSPAFALDAATFAISIATLARIRAGRRVAAPAAEDEPDDPRTLWQLVRSEPILPLIFAIDVTANLGTGGMSEVALPALAHGPLHAGPGGYGALIAAFAAGALAGTLIAGQVAVTRPAVAGSLAFATQSAVAAIVPYLGGAVGAGVLLVAFGALNGFGNTCTLTAFQRWAPRGTLGRLMGFLMAGSLGVFPISVLLGGIVVHWAGPQIFFPLSSVPLLGAVLYALTKRSWRDFGRVDLAATT